MRSESTIESCRDPLVRVKLGSTTSARNLYALIARTRFRDVSPAYEALCEAIAGSVEACALLDELAPWDRHPYRILSAAWEMNGPVDDPAGLVAFLIANWDAVTAAVAGEWTSAANRHSVQSG